jgi:hypothetical protein
MKRSVNDAIVPPQKPGEKGLEYAKRIAKLNGWLTSSGEPVKDFPKTEKARLPYKDPAEWNPREPGSDDE